jgi:hypothetical protein
MRPSAFAFLVVFPLLACRSAAPPAEPVAPLAPVSEEEFSNTLRWSTASEVDNFGFDVYRAETEEGPFERMTEDPIAGAGTTDLPSKYAFEDAAIDPETTYYYYVESISLQGVREQFTPIIRAPAKRPAEGASATDSSS